MATPTCPRCGTRGRPVSGITLAHHVDPDRLASLASRDGWHLCRDRRCPVVYYAGADTITLGAVLSTPYHKSDDPDRLVCFCFGHTVREVAADAALHETSTIAAEIRQACKEGRADCERKNPQGRCCLGDVAEVVAAAGGSVRPRQPVEAAAGEAAAEGCCSSDAPGGACETGDRQGRSATPGGESAGIDVAARREARRGIAAGAGALVAAVLSSACCWLPLGAVALGLSAGGAGAALERWRWPLLGLTALLLGVGFYLAYRKPRCAPGEACAVPDRRLQRVTRGMLWVSAALTVGFATFPEYVTALVGRGDAPVHAAAAETTAIYEISGMTCEGCASNIQKTLAALPGVAGASVSYPEGRAKVVWRRSPDHAAVVRAVEALGYGVTTHRP